MLNDFRIINIIRRESKDVKCHMVPNRKGKKGWSFLGEMGYKVMVHYQNDSNSFL